MKLGILLIDASRDVVVVCWNTRQLCILPALSLYNCVPSFGLNGDEDGDVFVFLMSNMDQWPLSSFWHLTFL